VLVPDYCSSPLRQNHFPLVPDQPLESSRASPPSNAHSPEKVALGFISLTMGKLDICRSVTLDCVCTKQATLTERCRRFHPRGTKRDSGPCTTFRCVFTRSERGSPGAKHNYCTPHVRGPLHGSAVLTLSLSSSSSCFLYMTSHERSNWR